MSPEEFDKIHVFLHEHSHPKGALRENIDKLILEVHRLREKVRQTPHPMAEVQSRFPGWELVNPVGETVLFERKMPDRRMARVYRAPQGYHGRFWPKGRNHPGSQMVGPFPTLTDAIEAVERTMMTDLERLGSIL